MDWAKVNDSFTVWPGAGYPLGGDFTNQQTVAGTTNILLPLGGILYGCGLIADSTFYYMLMHFALHIYE